jgi:hypothetical protein
VWLCLFVVSFCFWCCGAFKHGPPYLGMCQSLSFLWK